MCNTYCKIWVLFLAFWKHFSLKVEKVLHSAWDDGIWFHRKLIILENLDIFSQQKRCIFHREIWELWTRWTMPAGARTQLSLAEVSIYDFRSAKNKRCHNFCLKMTINYAEKNKYFSKRRVCPENLLCQYCRIKSLVQYLNRNGMPIRVVNRSKKQLKNTYFLTQILSYFWVYFWMSETYEKYQVIIFQK